VQHYKLEVGLLQRGDPADFILVKDLQHFEVLQTYIDGELVAENGISNINSKTSSVINRFDCRQIAVNELNYARPSQDQIEVIEALDGQLITNKYHQDIAALLSPDGTSLNSNPSIDILKIVVVNRYFPANPAIAFIKNFGFKKGAIASSVAHDSHNIVAVGTNDESLCNAINLVIEQSGGVSCVNDEASMVMALPVGGLMSNEDGYSVAENYTAIDSMAKALGSSLAAPFMTLSFMALLVIPHLKLSDKGLFDGDAFQLIQ
jgi:adenine deaminase